MADGRRRRWRVRGSALLGAVLAGFGMFPAVASATGAAAAEHSAMASKTASLSAKPQDAPTKPALGPGLHWLDVGAARKPALFVPARLASGEAVPMVVLLHGAGAGAADILPIMQAQAEALGFPLLVPQSQGPTWDVIMGGFGADVAVLDRALAAVFDSYRIDPERIAIAGFSDGASYALSLGLPNGGLFRHILAFSPGFVAPGSWAGKPKVFMSHGDSDAVLPIDRCSRRIAPALRKLDYEVDYWEFLGGHVVPAEMVKHALEGFLGP